MKVKKNQIFAKKKKKSEMKFFGKIFGPNEYPSISQHFSSNNGYNWDAFHFKPNIKLQYASRLKSFQVWVAHWDLEQITTSTGVGPKNTAKNQATI